MSRIYIRRSYVLLPLLIGLVAGVVACGGAQPIPTPTGPAPAQPAQPSPDAWVQFSFPPEDRAIPNPVVVEGYAAPSAEIVRIQIKDARGAVLGEQVISFGEPSDSPRGFSVQISYSRPNQATPGVIEAYFNQSSQPVSNLSIILSP